MTRWMQAALFLAWLLAVGSLAAAQPDQPTNRNTASVPAVGTQGMISSAHPLVVTTGWLNRMLKYSLGTRDASSEPIARAAASGFVERACSCSWPSDRSRISRA